MLKYTVKFYCPKQNKIIERDCIEFSFSDNLLYFYTDEQEDHCHSLHECRSYMISLREDSTLRFIFEGFQPLKELQSGLMTYIWKKVEIIPPSILKPQSFAVKVEEIKPLQPLTE